MRQSASLLIMLAYCVVLSGVTTAQDNSTAADTTVNSQVDDKQEPIPDADGLRRSRLEAEKRKKASILLGAVAGIAILGVAVIAFTMVWARRLRRLARELGPPQKTEGNDFWFLKPSKIIIDEAVPRDDSQPPNGPPSTELPK